MSDRIYVEREFLQEMLDHLKLQRDFYVQVLNAQIDPTIKVTLISRLEEILK